MTWKYRICLEGEKRGPAETKDVQHPETPPGQSSVAQDTGVLPRSSARRPPQQAKPYPAITLSSSGSLFPDQNINRLKK